MIRARSEMTTMYATPTGDPDAVEEVPGEPVVVLEIPADVALEISDICDVLAGHLQTYLPASCLPASWRRFTLGLSAAAASAARGEEEHFEYGEEGETR